MGSYSSPADSGSETEGSSQQIGGGAVGSGNYIVKPGDCITSIAHAFGFFWQTIWDHPGNADLKRIRKDPNILLPGDVLTIPPLTLREENKTTDQKHKFVLKGEPARLRLKIMMVDDDSPAGSSSDSGFGNDQNLPKPRANQPYTLVLDGTILDGFTDGDGMIDICMPPGTQRGRLTIGPDNMTIPLQFGSVDPLGELSGIQGRLNNLGFNCGRADGTPSEGTRAALMLFQEVYRLDQTGEPDSATLDKLKEIHGS
jgi:Putative peptidoglycan binding domain/LysM domain